MLLTNIDIIDTVLHAHTAAIGRDFIAYRNHVYRVTNLCMALSSGDTSRLEHVATAAVFHDIGIWTNSTFDYLAPSIARAMEYLNGNGKHDWAAEVTAMIEEHHKILPYRGSTSALVEPFRKADWIDVSWGVITHGISRRFIRELYTTWPDAGFHLKLIKLSAVRTATHPWSPLPMLRL